MSNGALTCASPQYIPSPDRRRMASTTHASDILANTRSRAGETHSNRRDQHDLRYTALLHIAAGKGKNEKIIATGSRENRKKAGNTYAKRRRTVPSSLGWAGPRPTFTYSSPRKAKRETAASTPCGNKVYRWPMEEKKRFIWNVHWNWRLGTPTAPSGESQQQKTTNTTASATNSIFLSWRKTQILSETCWICCFLLLQHIKFKKFSIFIMLARA